MITGTIFVKERGLIGVYIANYEIEAYPNHFSRNMPKRKISEEQIRSALAKVYVISDYYKSKIKLDKHVASFKRNAGGNEESVHYRITQHKSTSPYPWYSISENKVSSLKNSGIKTMLCLFFDDTENKGNSIAVYYKEVDLEVVEKTWKREDGKNGALLYRWNLNKDFRNEMAQPRDPKNNEIIGIAKG